MQSAKDEVEHWKSFWDGKTSPLHKTRESKHLESYSEELKLLFRDHKVDSILELGCGNGELYEFLGFHLSHRYTGVDFSQTMLNDFAKKYPGLDLVCADASNFRVQEKFDLIFANGVVQYFPKSALKRFLKNCSSMLDIQGSLVLGSVPWRRMRYAYASGQFLIEPHSTLFGAAVHLKRLFKDPMGRWYAPKEVQVALKDVGMYATICGSVHYPYRFHIVANKVGPRDLGVAKVQA